MSASKEKSFLLMKIKETNVKKLIKKKLFNTTTVMYLFVSIIFLLVSIHFWKYYIKKSKKSKINIANTKRCREIKTDANDKHTSTLHGYWFNTK